jgi:hypothetical protein
VRFRREFAQFKLSCSTPSTPSNSPWVCPRPHAPSPSLDQQLPLHVHPPLRHHPVLPTNSAGGDMSHGHHRVTWPIADNDNDTSPAPSHATRTMPCRVPPPQPLHATTIGLTAGRCPLRAATAIYVQCHTAITMTPLHDAHPPPSPHPRPSRTLNHLPGHPLHSPTCRLPNTTYVPPAHCTCLPPHVPPSMLMLCLGSLRALVS